MSKKWKPCNCLSEVINKVKDKARYLGTMTDIEFDVGFSMSNTGKTDVRPYLGFTFNKVKNGKVAKGKSNSYVQYSHCPFCGNPYEDPSLKQKEVKK